MKTIKIFDTTLRDGEQAPGCSMHLNEKIEVAQALEKLKVDVIEAGFAVISDGDFNSVKTIAESIKDCSVASLARAVKGDIESAYNAIKNAVSPRIHTFIATSDVHMKYKLKMTGEQVLERIRESVSFAKGFVNDVEFSAEDATRSDREFLAKAVSTAIKCGATVVNIPDTVGYTTPSEMYELIAYLFSNVSNINKAEISVHCHNDLGMAVANSLAAIRAGATQIECTINGLGERAGNAALEEIVMALKTRKDYFNAISNIDTTKISKTSKLVYSVIGQHTPLNKPIVGENAFSHEAGIHQHGVLANRETYEIMTQESVGLNKDNMVFGKHSGKHAIETRLIALGHTLTKEEMEAFFIRFKDLADKKKVINDMDMEALLDYNLKSDDKSGYNLDRFTVNAGNYITTNAVVRLSNKDTRFEEVALGDGPVDAAFNAIDKIMAAPKHSLENYSIRSVTEGKDALGEVFVRIRCGDRIVTGRGVSTDVIEASIMAYINGMNKIVN